MGIVENILEKLSLKDLAIHLKNYAELFINPIKTWKNVVRTSTMNYDLFVLHLIYYCGFLFFIVRDVMIAIPAVILEVIVTFFPLFIFIIPFKLFSKWYKIKHSWKNLFRLFLIIKLQFSPILLLLILFASLYDIESLYLMIGNMIMILWMAFIILFPLLNDLKFWKKMLWIIINYVFFLIGISLISYFIFNTENTSRTNLKTNMLTPNSEYLNSLPEHRNKDFDREHFIVALQAKKDSSLAFNQLNFFSSPELYLAFVYNMTQKPKSEKDSRNDSLLIKIMETDSGLIKKTVIDTSAIFQKLTLDQIKLRNIEIKRSFYNTLKNVNFLKDSSKFKSNREYFILLSDLLIYVRSYADSNNLFNFSDQPVEGQFNMPGGYVALLIHFNSVYYNDTKRKIMAMEEVFDKRNKKSKILSSILFYPLELLLHKGRIPH